MNMIWMKQAIRISFFTLALAVQTIVWAEELITAPQVCAAPKDDTFSTGAPLPFSSPKAIERFFRYISDLELKNHTTIPLPPDFPETLKHMDYWGYKFIKNKDTYDVFFIQTYNVNSMLTALVDVANSVKQSGCSFYSAKKVRVTSVQSRLILVQGELEGKERGCAGDSSVDLGDIEGDLTAKLTFGTEKTGGLRYHGQIILNDPTVTVSAHAGTLFGLDTDSVAGEIVAAVLNLTNKGIGLFKHPTAQNTIELMNLLDQKTLRYVGNPQIAFTAATLNGSTRSKEYNDFLRSVASYTWSSVPYFEIDDEATGLSGDANKAQMTLSYKATLSSSQHIDQVYCDANNEVSIIGSFSQPEKVYAVQKGDTLWKIAAQEYGHPRYMSFMAGMNQLDRTSASRLRVGQMLKKLPLFQLAVLPDTYFVLPGDTLSSICTYQMKMKNLTMCLKQIHDDNPTLKSDRIFALEPLKIRSLPKHSSP